jgi:MYND finger
MCILGLATWKACSEFKKFFIDAIHRADHGVAFIPYHLVFFDYDLMEGSDNEDDPKNEPWRIELACGAKHNIIVSVLNWIVEKPFTAAYEKACGKEDVLSFSSIQSKERKAKEAAADKELVCCAGCSAQKPRKEFNTCSQCNTPPYCNASCQRAHWKLHKRECKRMKEERKSRRKQYKAVVEKAEEKKAEDLVDELMDDTISRTFPNLSQQPDP